MEVDGLPVSYWDLQLWDRPSIAADQLPSNDEDFMIKKAYLAYLAFLRHGSVVSLATGALSADIGENAALPATKLNPRLFS